MKFFFNFRTASFTTQPLRPAALALLVALGSASTAQAQQPQATVTQTDAESLRVRLDNPNKRPARLVVVQLDNNRWLLSETHREPVYSTLLKFNTLPAGRYAIFLRVGHARYHYTVQVQTQPQGPTVAVRKLTTHGVAQVEMAAAAL